MLVFMRVICAHTSVIERVVRNEETWHQRETPVRGRRCYCRCDTTGYIVSDCLGLSTSLPRVDLCRCPPWSVHIAVPHGRAIRLQAVQRGAHDLIPLTDRLPFLSTSRSSAMTAARCLPPQPPQPTPQAGDGSLAESIFLRIPTRPIGRSVRCTRDGAGPQ